MKTLMMVLLLVVPVWAQCPEVDFSTRGPWPYFMDVWSVDAELVRNGTMQAETQGTITGEAQVRYYPQAMKWGVIIHVHGDDPQTPDLDGALQGDIIRLRASWLKDCGYIPTLMDLVYTEQDSHGMFVLAAPGDLNRDGALDMFDVQVFAEAVLRGGTKPDPTVHYDVNGDCAENMADLNLLAEVIWRGGDEDDLKYGCAGTP